MKNLYGGEFYDDLKDGVRSSAEVVVPIVMDLVRPSSVVDVGCGTGIWLSVFARHGVIDILGVDGNHVDRDKLEIPADRFTAADISDRIPVTRKFDLAACLEVAEHISSERSSDFIRSLTGIAPVILFSAAIPYQGGTGHINEKWPGYWRKLFNDNGFVLVDCLRRRIWENEKVEYWYAQNLFLFVHKDVVDKMPALAAEAARNNDAQLALVHPRLYLKKAEICENGMDISSYPFTKILKSLPKAFSRALRRRIFGAGK